MSNEKEIFKNYLKEQDLRVTEARMKVLEAVFGVHSHFSAEDIILLMKQEEEEDVARATIYRTLKLLVDAELIEKYKFQADKACYEHVHGHQHHDHLICVRCGRFIEFYSEKLEGIQDEICEEKEFTPEDHTLTIRGVCEECRE